MLEIKNVHQSFRTGFWMKRAEILKDISFSVPDKSIFGFLGPNGAGKTTLIHLIVGLKQPVSGSLKINGLDCHSPEARAKIGYLPERPYFYDHLTGAKLLRYFGELSGMTEEQITKRTPEVLAAVSMTHARDLELKKYSKGMLQRIGIAQAMIHNPEFLVLDEPMSGLDPVGRKEMRELILKLAKEGRTIFFSSHVIPDVEAICDQVAIIRKGELLECGPISKFLSQKNEEVEVAFKGLSIDVAKKLGSFHSIREFPDGIRAVIKDQSSFQSLLPILLSNHAQILSVNPIRPSLEDMFQ
jgi:ABC-2 type transport system ATP-binding protein